MRTFMALCLIAALSIAVDAVLLNGRYSNVAWQGLKAQALKFNRELDHQFRRLGL
jgi:hypothetical protein